MHKTVIINRGIPASGKSTYAQRIADVLPEKGLRVAVCSTDDYFVVDGVYRFDRDRLREYHLKNQERFRQALDERIDLVICDNTNIEPWEARPYFMMAKEHDYRVILMDFVARGIEGHLQMQANGAYQHNVPLEYLEIMMSAYENYGRLTDKSSYPSPGQPERFYDESTGQVEISDRLAEPFFYDELIRIIPKDYLAALEIIPEMIFEKMRDFSLDLIPLVPYEYQVIMRAFGQKSDKILTAYELEPILGKSARHIDRYFEEMQSQLHNIIKVKKERKNAYKLIDRFDVYLDAFRYHEEIDDLIYLAQESSPELFDRLGYRTTAEEDLYLFRGSILEHVPDRALFEGQMPVRALFVRLKDAIRRHEYRTITFLGSDTVHTIKPIRLVFVDNNWYLAYVTEEDALRLGRVAFILRVEYADKNTYQPRSVERHITALKTRTQNAMTLFDVSPKIATLRATPAIARYFESGMKRFFSSQKFEEKREDGSILFTLEFTQELEILPFIQRWMPDLIIESPNDLREAYLTKLQSAAMKHV